MTLARMLSEKTLQSISESAALSLHEMISLSQDDSAAIEADIELGGIDQKFNILVEETCRKPWGWNHK